MKVIIGADEAGYGSIAGPMVMVAVAAWDDVHDDKVRDSKKVKKETELAGLRTHVLANCIDYEVCALNNAYIDRNGGTYKVQREGLKLVLSRLVEKIHLDAREAEIVVDGNIHLDLPFAYRGVPHADNIYWPVAAASILAKHRQLEEMNQLHEKYPKYDFIHNRGYNTADHVVRLKKHGPSPVHRRTNKTIQNLKPVKGRER